MRLCYFIVWNIDAKKPSIVRLSFLIMVLMNALSISGKADLSQGSQEDIGPIYGADRNHYRDSEDIKQNKIGEFKASMRYDSFGECILRMNPNLKVDEMNYTTLMDALESNEHFQYCVSNDITLRSSTQDIGKGFGFDDIFEFKRSPRENNNMSQYGDCLYLTRTAIKPYPGDCYDKLLVTDRQKMFSAWWSQSYGDILYAFDFVMNDELMPYRKENHLWYLIAYIKYVAREIENPLDFVYYLNSNEAYQAKITEVEEHIEYIEAFIEYIQNTLESFW